MSNLKIISDANLIGRVGNAHPTDCELVKTSGTIKIREIGNEAIAMTESIAARKIKLADLKEQFNLQYTDDESVFSEWQESLPPLNDAERQALDRVKRNYLYLLEYPVMESIVKMVVLSPLLDLAGFYTPPFRVDGETSIQVSAEDDGDMIQGSIDVLVLQNQLWITVIEVKNSEFSITKAIPQTLAYMLAKPNQTLPTFGLVLNGSEFLFLKVLETEKSANEIYYSRSNLFSLLNRGIDSKRIASPFSCLTN